MNSFSALSSRGRVCFGSLDCLGGIYLAALSSIFISLDSHLGVGKVVVSASLNTLVVTAELTLQLQVTAFHFLSVNLLESTDRKSTRLNSSH